MGGNHALPSTTSPPSAIFGGREERGVSSNSCCFDLGGLCCSPSESDVKEVEESPKEEKLGEEERELRTEEAEEAEDAVDC